MRIGVRSVVAIASYAGAVALFLAADFGSSGLELSRRDAAPPPPSATASATAPQKRDAPRRELRELRLLNRSIGYVRNNYVDPDRVEPRKMLSGALSQLQLAIPEVIVRFEGDRPAPDAVELRASAHARRFEVDKLGDLYELSWQLKEIVGWLDAHLSDQVARDEVELALVNGMLQTLDPHSVLLSADVFEDMQVGTTGRFGGLGIVISARRGDLTVMSVLDGTPAQRAGVQVGDVVRQVADESTVNMSIDDAVSRLRGEVGTAVTIWLERKGWGEPRSFRITREEIKIESVASRDLGRGVGYVRLKQFQQHTAQDLKDALANLEAKGSAKRGLVLDLRDNPGGLLDQAVEISDLFVAEGTIVTTEGAAGQRVREEKKARRKGTRGELPLVILVSSGSASASEVVTGALKNNDRAVVVGNQTFGKGSVQVLYEMKDHEERTAALKLTVAQYLTPGDESIQSVGITPDVLAYPVALTPAHVDLYVTTKDLIGEAELDNHLSSERDHERARSIASARLFRYYEPEPEPAEGEDDEHAALLAEPEDDPEADFLIRFARDLLLAAGKPSREASLRGAEPFFARAATEQDATIRARLSELGVPWPAADGPASTGGRASVTLTTTPAALEVQAGDTVRVTARAQNLGDGPLWRLRGVTTSENEWFDNREFVFGTLQPGEAREWSFEVELPRSAVMRRDPIEVQLFDDRAAVAGAEASLSVAVRGRPRPRFEVAWRLDDDEGGNGDGLAQRGEALRLHVEVRNTGEGRSETLRANLRNESGRGVYLSEGKARLPDGLEPGASAHFTYEFDVKETLSADEIELALSLVDTRLRANVSVPLRMPVLPPVPPPVAAEADRVAGELLGVVAGVPLRAGADVRTPELARTTGPGALEALGARGDWVRVRGVGGEPAWVRAEDLAGPVRMASKEAMRPPSAPLARIWAERPPQVILPPIELSAIEVTTTHFPLRARALFDPDSTAPRDAYVYRNDDKIAYEAAQSPAGGAIDLSVDVPLEPGANAIRVYARQGEGGVDHVLFYVHRLAD